MLDNIQLEHLVLGPFWEIVVKAKTALANAESAAADGTDIQIMRRAAQSLLTKSERALSKIEPICERLLGEYGVGFVDAVKESGRSCRIRLKGVVETLGKVADQIMVCRGDFAVQGTAGWYAVGF